MRQLRQRRAGGPRHHRLGVANQRQQRVAPLWQRQSPETPAGVVADAPVGILGQLHQQGEFRRRRYAREPVRCHAAHFRLGVLEPRLEELEKPRRADADQRRDDLQALVTRGAREQSLQLGGGSLGMQPP